MVAGGGSGDVCEVVVAECELFGVGEVDGYVGLGELLADACRVPCEPGAVTVVWVAGWRVGRPGHLGPVDAGDGSEVVVERVILLDDDHDMVYLATGETGHCASRHGAIHRRLGMDLCYLEPVRVFYGQVLTLLSRLKTQESYPVSFSRVISCLAGRMGESRLTGRNMSEFRIFGTSGSLAFSFTWSRRASLVRDRS